MQKLIKTTLMFRVWLCVAPDLGTGEMCTVCEGGGILHVGGGGGRHPSREGRGGSEHTAKMWRAAHAHVCMSVRLTPLSTYNIARSVSIFFIPSDTLYGDWSKAQPFRRPFTGVRVIFPCTAGSKNCTVYTNLLPYIIPANQTEVPSL